MSEVITASPNEAEAIRLEEFRRARLQRLLQVRDAERQRSKSIRSNAEEQVAIAKGDLRAKVTREVAIQFRQAMQSTRQRLRSAETSVGESFAAAQQHQEVLAVEARADYEALSRSVHVAAQRHHAAVQVEAAISSISPSAVTRQRAQRMANVRQEAAQESVSWASSRPPVQPKLNDTLKPAASRRHKPADATAFHTSHHHFGAGLLYPHSGPDVQVVRHPRSSAGDSFELPTTTPDASSLSAPPPAVRHVTPDVGRRALAQQSALAQSFLSAGDNGQFSRAWPQPRGTSPLQTDDDQPNPLPAPQPRVAPVAAPADNVMATATSLHAIEHRGNSLDSSSQHEQWSSHLPQPTHYAAGQFVPSVESSFASHTLSSTAAAPAALPLKLVGGDGRLTMSATEIAQRIAELHRVRAVQEEAKSLKQEATIVSRGRDAAAFLREQSEAKSASAAVEQVIKHAEQTRRQAARVIAPPLGASSLTGSVPENVREKAFERLLFQPAASKHSAAAARTRDPDATSVTAAPVKKTAARDCVAQPLPSSLSLRGAMLRDSSVPAAVIADAVPDHTVDAGQPASLPPSTAAVAHVARSMPSDSDSSCDSLELSQRPPPQLLSDSTSDSEDLWPPKSARIHIDIPLPKQTRPAARAPGASFCRSSSSSNADDVRMSDSSSASASPPSSPYPTNRATNTATIASPKAPAPAPSSSHQQVDNGFVSLQHRAREPNPFPAPPSTAQRSSAPLDATSPTPKPSFAYSDAEHANSVALLSPQSSRSAKELDCTSPSRTSSTASFDSKFASNVRPEHSSTAPSPSRVPVSPAHARVRILIPSAPLSPEPAAVIRSPPASNVSTPSDLQSPSLLQHVNILRDLRGSPIKGAAFHQQNSSFGEAASLAAMDDYSARGSVDDSLHARLSTDTWMRLSAARSSVASLENDLHERNHGSSSTLLPQSHAEIEPSSDSSSETDVHESIANAGEFASFFHFQLAHSTERCRAGISATAAVRRAIERIGGNSHDYVADSRESKPAPRVAWNLPSRDFALPDPPSSTTSCDGPSSQPHPTDHSSLDPSFWLTSFGAQHDHDVSDSSELEAESHVHLSTRVSNLARSPQASRQLASARSSLSASSASASNNSIREAIESYRKATMFVMPPDISSDSDDGDLKGPSARHNVSISSDSESEQSENVGDTIDYLNRRVRLERDQLLQTAESRARSSQSLHHSSGEQSQPQRVCLKPQPRRRVAFAASPSSKTSNPHVLPHELKHVHIIAETERRWKNLPEVRCTAIQSSASLFFPHFGRCRVKCSRRRLPSLVRPLGKKQN
jgi:hypothetical protein